MSLLFNKGKLRAGHSPRSDELADPVPEVPERVNRGKDGRFLDAQSAKVVGRKGGLQKAANARKVETYARKLGIQRHLPELKDNEYIVPVLDESSRWFTETAAELGAEVGGGKVGAIAGTMLELAAFQRAFALYFMALASKQVFSWKTDDGGKPAPDTRLVEVANRLVEGFRTSAVGAWDVCARSAKGRPAHPGTLPPWMRLVEAPKPEGEKP